MPDAYDPTDFPPLAVTVDLVLMTVTNGGLAVLLQRRGEAPHKGDWALPGGFVRVDESLDAAAGRILADKAGLADAWLEQLYSFGDPGRDPRPLGAETRRLRREERHRPHRADDRCDKPALLRIARRTRARPHQ